MSKHTPGPWHTGGDGTIIYDADGWGIANATVFHGRQNPGAARANALLIAKAPDLRRALESLVLFTKPSRANAAALNFAHQVLADIEGQPS